LPLYVRMDISMIFKYMIYNNRWSRNEVTMVKDDKTQIQYPPPPSKIVLMV